jgi:hypothetical protein
MANVKKGTKIPSSLHNYQYGWEQPRTRKVGVTRAEGGNASGQPRRWQDRRIPQEQNNTTLRKRQMNLLLSL